MEEIRNVDNKAYTRSARALLANIKDVKTEHHHPVLYHPQSGAVIASLGVN